MATQQSAVHQMVSTPQFSPAELALLERPQMILEDPAPHSKRGQQVQRLEQLGLHKAAGAVKVCGRLGEVWNYACGKSALREIIRSHRRFCCPQCDRHVAGRLFKQHRAYLQRLHRSGTLHRVSLRSGDYPLSSDGIRNFERTAVKAVGRWLEGFQEWGFKSLTHYENGAPVMEGILYLPPGTSLPSRELSIPRGSCRVGVQVDVTAFEALLADILTPKLVEGHSVFRAELMAAFQGGNHLRSMGVLFGLISKKRDEERRERTAENLDLSSKSSDGSGTALAGSSALRRPDMLTCPHCGPGCQRVSISIEPMSELRDIPNLFENSSTDRAWAVMQGLLRRKHVF